MEKTDITKKTRNMAHDEDSLIVFVIRLMQLRGKRYRWSSPVQTLSVDLEGKGKPVSLSTIRFGTPDTDELVSYLSVVRQFWLQKEPTYHNNIAGILFNAACLLADTEMQQRLKGLRDGFKEQSSCSYSFTRGEKTVRLSNEEMVNFWFNTFYFHTDLNRLREAELILSHDFTREFARQHFEGYLDRFVTYSRQLGIEALGVLWKGIFPKGSLHYLLDDHTYKEIRPLLDRLPQHSPT